MRSGVVGGNLDRASKQAQRLLDARSRFRTRPLEEDVLEGKEGGRAVRFDEEPTEVSRRIGRYGTSPDGAVFITARDGKLGRGKEAIALYQMLPSSHEALDEARFDELGMDVAWQQHDPPRAIALYEVATALHPQSLRLHIGLADAYARADRRHEARTSYARAKELLYRAPALSDHDELYVRARFAWLEHRALGDD